MSADGETRGAGGTGGAVRPVRRLRAGDEVRLVSPCSPPYPERLREGVRMLREWGLVPTFGDHRIPDGISTRPAAERAAEFQDALTDPTVRAVLVTRAGSGGDELVPLLDFSTLERQPKPVCGFSDVTHFHGAIAATAQRPSFHTPELAWNRRLNGPRSASALRELLMGHGRPVRVGPDAVARSHGPAAAGRIRGGNLSTLVHVEPPAHRSGDVLFLEELREPPAGVAALLARITERGHADDVAAVVLGQFIDCGEQSQLRTVLESWCDSVTGTVLAGVPVGHGTEQESLALGWPVEVDPVGGVLAYTTSPASAVTGWD
jgi:muramoyltetrapeptide carboxypeptidase